MTNPDENNTLRGRFGRWLRGKTEQAAVTSQVDDSPGWAALTGRPHDYDPAQVQELYNDTLSAWRKNPLAWRMIAITSDYVVGDALRLSSPNRALARFIRAFWDHPQNHMDLRLEAMCDELSRAGDLFVLLFRNAQDGMSYLRFVTKDCICQIRSAPNDWEQELAFQERLPDGSSREWLSPQHPEAPEAAAVMLHYSVNRPLGALLGESDLATMLPWLQRYSRMLEDRVRLHWATRAFLWMVTVPPHKIAEKREQYRVPPESGTLVIKDAGENWEAVAPDLKAADAAHDLRAVRQLIDAGSGYPPHWRGEPADANLATATAMQAPTERHLLRRQKYFTFILQDILYQAYQRAVQAGKARPLPAHDGPPAYDALFTLTVPDISATDNEALARAARDLAQALETLRAQLPGHSDSYAQIALKLVCKFAGEPLPPEQAQVIMGEARGEKI